MDRTYPYSRRLASRERMRKRMGAVALAALAGASVLLGSAWMPDRLSTSVSATEPVASSLPSVDGQAGAHQAGGLRRIYPYSVIPGGVASGTELARVIRSDRVVAVHYASFDVAKARAVVVAKPRAVHVSYRKGDQVYWTAHKVMLAAGETLLTDGRNDMRARCANRISDVPQYPVEAHQPAMEELDNPVELAESGQDASGAEGLPVAMPWVDDGPGQAGPGFVALGSGGGAAAALASGAYSPRPADGGPPFTTALMASLNSLGSRPPTSASPATPPLPAGSPGAAPHNPPASEGSGGTSGAPVPTASPADPIPAAADSAGTPVATPLPDAGTTPPPTASPADVQQSGGGGTEAPPPAPGPLFPLPEPEPAALIPPVVLHPGAPPAGAEAAKPPPASIPEPGSIWLVGAALALLALLRRRARRGALSQGS